MPETNKEAQRHMSGYENKIIKVSCLEAYIKTPADWDKTKQKQKVFVTATASNHQRFQT